MTAPLREQRIAFLATDGVEEVEYLRPRQAIEAVGAQVDLVSVKPTPMRAFQHLDPSNTYEVDVTVANADPGWYDGLVLPGGVANPDALRTDPDALRFVRAFFEAGKPVGAICHGPWTMIDAGVVEGRTMTSWPSLRTDLENAGAKWVDEECHVDNGLVTSRKPDDLPAFCAKILEEFTEGRH